MMPKKARIQINNTQKWRDTMRKLMFLVCIMFLVGGFSVNAIADGTGLVQWTQPTSYTDGTAIGAAKITNNVYCGTAAGVYGAPVLVTTGTSYTVAIKSGTTEYCVITAIVGGMESVKSNEVSKTIALPTPNGCVTTMQ